MGEQSASSGRPGRPRSEASRQAILEAALELLRAGGYPAVTMKGLAEVAGTGRQTVYRWWNSPAEVLMDALAERARVEVIAADQGSLRADLEAFLVATFAALSRPDGTAQAVRALMAQAQMDAAFALRFQKDFLARRRAALEAVFERAVRRGQWHSRDVELGLDVTFGVLWYRLLASQGPLDDRLARELAHWVAARGC